MFVGWIPIAIAAASAIGSVVSAAGKRGQAKRQAALIDDMIEIEDEIYELNKDGRTWEEATRRFNNLRVKYDMQTNKRQSILNTKLQTLSTVKQEQQGRRNLNLLRNQTNIEASANQQQLAAEATQVGKQTEQIAGQAGQTLNGVPSVQSQADDSLQGLKNMEAMQIARESILGSSYQTQDDLYAGMRQNKQFAERMLTLNTDAKKASIQTQKDLSKVRQRTARQAQQFDISLIQLGHKGAKLAHRAEQLQQRALATNQKEGDELTHQAKVAQLKLGQPSAPSLIPSLIGGATSIASAVYGHRATRTPAPQLTNASAPSVASGGLAVGAGASAYNAPRTQGLLSMNLDGGQYGGMG